MVARSGKPPQGPEVTDRDLEPIAGSSRRFDLEDEVTARRDPEPTASGAGPGDEGPTGEAYLPGNTLDGPDEPISAPPTAILGDDDDEPPEDTAKSEPTGHKPQRPQPEPAIRAKLFAPSPIDIASGDRVVGVKRRVPIGADAYEPIARGDLTGSTARNLSQSFGMLARWRGESWPVKLGLLAAIVSLTTFVFWLVFLAAR